MVSVEVFVMVTLVRAATVTPLLMPTSPAGLVNVQWATVRPPGLTHMARFARVHQYSSGSASFFAVIDVLLMVGTT